MIECKKAQSFVVTAYKDFENLSRIVKRLSPDFNIFIHVDSSSTSITDEDIKQLNSMANVYVEKRLEISWGSYKHLLAILSLSRRALSFTSAKGYIHLISGQDIPIRSNKEFLSFFDNNTSIYMDCRTLDEMEPHQLKMFQIKNHFWKYNYWNKCVHLLRDIDTWFQRKFIFLNDNFGGVKNVAQGLVWMSLPCDAARYVLDYLESHPAFLKDIFCAQIPEEFVFQTVLVNSPFKENINQNNLRYADWSRRNGSLPAYLDLSDLNKIVNSECFFARKIDSKIAKELLKQLGY